MNSIYEVHSKIKKQIKTKMTPSLVTCISFPKRMDLVTIESTLDSNQ